MKILILYKSREGSTKKYAEWLHDEFSKSDLVNIDEADNVDFNKYEVIVLGSSTYGGQILAKDFIEKHWNRMKGKVVYLMIIGVVPQEAKASKKAYGSISEEIRKGFAGYIKLPGKLTKLTPFSKFMMKLFLGVDPKKLVEQDEVKKKDLKLVVDFLQEKNN